MIDKYPWLADFMLCLLREQNTLDKILLRFRDGRSFDGLKLYTNTNTRGSQQPFVENFSVRHLPLIGLSRLMFTKIFYKHQTTPECFDVYQTPNRQNILKPLAIYG